MAKLPRIGNVEDQLYEQKNRKNCQSAVLSAEKYAFEKWKTSEFCVSNVLISENETAKLFSSQTVHHFKQCKYLQKWFPYHHKNQYRDNDFLVF